MTNANVRNNLFMSVPADSLSDEEFLLQMKKSYSRKNSNSMKALAPALILETLKRFSSPEKHLTQKQLIEKLFSCFEVTIERKAVCRSIDALNDCGFSVFHDRSGLWFDETLQRDLFE